MITKTSAFDSTLVSIAGAGPGDPELLTLKAARAIQNADAILYDKLVNPELLKMAKPGCELIYVGKEPGRPCKSQDEINTLLVQTAQRKKHVLRLKGGDPFIFGRGSEEALFLKKNGIRFEIIPGVSSSIAAPAYAGIPVTHRKMACSYVVVTGHEAPGKPESQVNWKAIAGVDVILCLMGVGHRQEIARSLLDAGRNPNDPVAFVHEGTKAQQLLLKTTLQELATQPIEVESPAVMVIGPVVDLSSELQWWIPQEALARGETSPTHSPVSLVQ